MALFKYINKNLYDMFFKPELKCKNQYDYLTMVYGWHSEKIDNFKRSKCDFNKISYQWMKNSMPAYFFDFKLAADGELINKEDVFILTRQEDSDLYRSGMNCRQPVRAENT